MLRGHRLYAIHPLLFAAFNVLFLYAQNAKEMPLEDLFLPLAIVLAATTAAVGVFTLILRNIHKAALVSSIGILLFFSFGHVVSLLPAFSIMSGDFQLGRKVVVMAAWGLMFLTGFWLTARTRRDLATLTRALGQIAAILVVVQIAQGGYVVLSRALSTPAHKETNFSVGEVPERRPDVYYIIMDAYARSDILKNIYEHDNSPFLDSLRRRGFYVADSSYANYGGTTHSLAASLNMNYVPDIADFDTESDDYVPLSSRLKDNEVFDLFRRMGYSIVTFSSRYAHTEIKDADLYITESAIGSEFINVLPTATPLAAFQSTEENQCGRHRQHILNTLGKIPDVHEVPSPKLVFAHLVSPHPPFVFGPNGEPVQPDWGFTLNDAYHLIKDGCTFEQYVSGYRDQITYINKCILKTVDSLLSGDVSDHPIVILQGDHGPRSSTFETTEPSPKYPGELYAILNAYYFPRVEASLLYPGITPVNSFRAVFDSYFGTDFGLLPDRIYGNSWERPYEFEEITNKLDRDLPLLFWTGD